MKPDNIYQDHRQHIGFRHGNWRHGWQAASVRMKALALLSSLLAVGLAITLLLRGHWAALSLGYVSMLWLYYFGWQARALNLLPAPASLLAVCRHEQGQCWIGDTALPATLGKVVLAPVPDQPELAYLQLPWNGGWQWVFDRQELTAVRSWLLQHYPALQFHH